LHGGDVPRQKIQYIHVHSQPEEPRQHKHERNPQPMARSQFHGCKYPSIVSPVRAWVSFHPSAVPLKVHCRVRAWPCNPLAKYNHPSRWTEPRASVSAPTPLSVRPCGGNEICHASLLPCDSTSVIGVFRNCR